MTTLLQHVYSRVISVNKIIVPFFFVHSHNDKTVQLDPLSHGSPLSCPPPQQHDNVQHIIVETKKFLQQKFLNL